MQKETQEDIERVQARIGERIEDINANMNNVKGQVINNKEKIEEIHQRELVNIREELEMIRSRPFSISNVQPTDNREVINFKNYKKNPMEFLERIEENIARHRETRWTSIRSILDEHFKNINDNWWTTTRHDIQDYQEFKTLFKAKYLSLIHI